MRQQEAAPGGRSRACHGLRALRGYAAALINHWTGRCRHIGLPEIAIKIILPAVPAAA
jgi:hypothetical protein